MVVDPVGMPGVVRSGGRCEESSTERALRRDQSMAIVAMALRVYASAFAAACRRDQAP
jgi:hypothetical protein